MSSLHRASTDALILQNTCNNYEFHHVTTFSSDGITVSVTSSSTSLTISWTLEQSLTATGYTISYSNTNTDCFSDSRSGIFAGGTSYTLTGLEEATEYSVTVTASLTGGGAAEDDMTITTMTTG